MNQIHHKLCTVRLLISYDIDFSFSFLKQINTSDSFTLTNVLIYERCVYVLKFPVFDNNLKASRNCSYKTQFRQLYASNFCSRDLNYQNAFANYGNTVCNTITYCMLNISPTRRWINFMITSNTMDLREWAIAAHGMYESHQV